MNLLHLRHAKTIAETGSFSAAARELGVSQPSISIAIADLEERLQGKLFKRTTRHVELTEFGKQVLPFIDAVLLAVDELEQRASAFLNPNRRTIRVAFSPVVDSRRLMALLEPFKEGHPDVEIVYKECSLGDLEERLDHDQIDLICGIRLRNTATRERVPLFRDVLRFLPRGGASENGSNIPVSLSRVAEEILIFTGGACGFAPLARELFRQHKLRLHEYPGEAMSFQVVQDWTEVGIGAAILPDSQVVGDSSTYPLVEWNAKPVTITYEAVWNKGEGGLEHIQAFREYLRLELPVHAEAINWGPRSESDTLVRQ